ncbi:MAG: hypothetical protein AB7F43_00910 [Bacteriovoracia bacterium]
MSAFCYKCSSPVEDFNRNDTCNKCGAHTRVCKNCTFYDLAKYNECAENQAERVVDKEKSNFCDYFKPKQGKTTSGQVSPQDAAKAAAEALFRKKT